MIVSGAATQLQGGAFRCLSLSHSGGWSQGNNFQQDQRCAAVHSGRGDPLQVQYALI